MDFKKAILVTGGAGYIGSHVALYCIKKGHHVIILDNYSQGQELLPFPALVVKGDYGDPVLMDTLFSTYAIQSVIHCGASTLAITSMTDPLSYYDNNVSKTVILLQQMVKHNVLKFVFSSSCAVYGNQESALLNEEHRLLPVNPYGKTKVMVEQILADCAHSYGIQFVSLRYFNAFGIEPGSGLKENHIPETHLIPLLWHTAYLKIPFYIFGTDYDTPDGTCIRDYVHVYDSASAHYKALEYLEKENPSDIFNIGMGKGWSVKEVIKAVELVTQQKIQTRDALRREGDPERLVADPFKAIHILGWKPVYSDLISGIASLLG